MNSLKQLTDWAFKMSGIEQNVLKCKKTERDNQVIKQLTDWAFKMSGIEQNVLKR